MDANALFHGGSDLGILIIVSILGWFLRDLIRQLRIEIGTIGLKIDDHVRNCAHWTPHEKDLFDELIDLRFNTIDKALGDMRTEMVAIEKRKRE